MGQTEIWAQITPATAVHHMIEKVLQPSWLITHFPYPWNKGNKSIMHILSVPICYVINSCMCMCCVYSYAGTAVIVWSNGCVILLV